MTVIRCPSCGNAVNVPQKNAALPWVVGCAVALVAIPIVVAVIGLLAAIAIPSFVKARQTSQLNACVSNMRQIDSAKESWAMANSVGAGQSADVEAINQYVKGATTPVCPARGVYTYYEVGHDPECSEHGPLSDPGPPGRSVRRPSAARDDVGGRSLYR